MSNYTRSDATGTEFMDTDAKSTEKSVEDTVREAMAKANKATAFLNEPHMRANIGGGGAGAQQPSNMSYRTPPGAGTTTNQFNIVGGTIGQAAIGNQGSVVFNQEKKVFKKGASHTQYKITGGNFNQANIGGTAAYNNKDSKIGGGGHAGGTALTVEYLALRILENGVSTKQLIKLLEKKYTLANIAFAIPRDEMLKDRMIDALLIE